MPRTGCQSFHVCHAGALVQRLKCGGGLLYSIERGYCDHAYRVTCIEPICTDAPTLFPTLSPSLSPTKKPTASPTMSPTKEPTGGPTRSPTSSPTGQPTIGLLAMNAINRNRALIEEYVLVAKNSDGDSYPSVRYTFDGLYQSVLQMGVIGFGYGFQFYLGEGYQETYVYGLVNLSAFLANAMVESIQFDACDENNWQQVAGRYAISNSCGQEGRSYQDEECGEEYSCAVDPSMTIIGITSGNGVRAPPPLSCKPGSGDGNYAGYWDTNTGTEIKDTPYANTVGRIDTEGALRLLMEDEGFNLVFLIWLLCCKISKSILTACLSF